MAAFHLFGRTFSIHFALLGRKRKYVKSKTIAKLIEKRTSIAGVWDKLGQFDTFPTPLLSRCRLPFKIWTFTTPIVLAEITCQHQYIVADVFISWIGMADQICKWPTWHRLIKKSIRRANTIGAVIAERNILTPLCLALLWPLSFCVTIYL